MKKNRRQLVLGALCIGLVSAVTIGGTLAFLTDSEQVTNHFSMGDLDITITEDGWDDDGNPDDGTPGDGEGLVPGDTKDKDPTIHAVTGDSYMRVVLQVQNKDGTAITDKERLDLVMKTVYYSDPVVDASQSYSLAQLSKLYHNISTVSSSFKLNAEKSSTDDDPTGVYYYDYDGVFEEGAEATLFTNVVIPTDWNQTQIAKLGQYQIVVYAQAIQADNFESAADAFAALDAEIENGTLQVDYKTVGQNLATTATTVVSPT